MTFRPTQRIRSSTLSSIVLALAIAACGDDDGGDDGTKVDSGSPGKGDAQVSPDSGTGIDSGIKTDSGTPPKPDAGPAADSGTTPTDAGGGTGIDSGTPDSGTTADSGVPTYPTLNGCEDSAYTDLSSGTRTIKFGGSLGNLYAPKCISVTAGQKVTFEGNFGAHPLAPGNAANALAGSANNPITATNSGSTPKEFTFPTAGTYAYYCTAHSQGVGLGMAGAIRVK